MEEIITIIIMLIEMFAMYYTGRTDGKKEFNEIKRIFKATLRKNNIKHTQLYFYDLDNTKYEEIIIHKWKSGMGTEVIDVDYCENKIKL